MWWNLTSFELGAGGADAAQLSPPEASSLYRVIVRTSGTRPESYLFPLPLRSQLGDIPIPLRATDKVVDLKLQQLIDTVYEDGRYEETIDYGEPLDPALPEEDGIWGRAVAQGVGKL